MTLYQVVHSKATIADEPTDIFAYAEIRGYRFTKLNTAESNRVELRGQPRFANLYGPMWGGLKDGQPVIRYEDHESYDLLSR